MLGAIQELGEPCQSPFNAGFLTHLYLIRTQDVVFVLTPQSGTLYQAADAIGILPGSKITQFLIRPKTATLSEGRAETLDGVAYSSTISFPMKGTLPGLTNWMFQNSNRRYVVLARDTQGNCYVAGDQDNGARISWARENAQLSQHRIALSLTDWHPLQFIPVIDLDELFPDAEFDYNFSSDFS